MSSIWNKVVVLGLAAALSAPVAFAADDAPKTSTDSVAQATGEATAAVENKKDDVVDQAKSMKEHAKKGYKHKKAQHHAKKAEAEAAKADAAATDATATPAK